MRHMKKIIIIVLVLAIASLYLFAFNMKASSMVDTNLRAYSSEDFMDANGLTNTNRLVAAMMISNYI